MMRRRINKNNYLSKLAKFDNCPPKEESTDSIDSMDSNEFYAQTKPEVPIQKSHAVIPGQQKVAREVEVKVKAEAEAEAEVEEEAAEEEINIKIAKEPTSEEQALINVDEALDLMIVAIQALEENLKDVATETDKEKSAINKIQDLMDSALAPYLSDILKEMQVFDK